ncbi:MAG: hypothetical protein ABJB40_10220, partial [Acidobacteriota bacterium]
MPNHANPLDSISIASPCSSNWNDMNGTERRRFCQECKLNVYNLSDMTQMEAKSFLIGSEGRVCLRVYRRSDGTVITKDCPSRAQRLKKRASNLATACLALFAGFIGGLGIFNSYTWLCDLVAFDSDRTESPI